MKKKIFTLLVFAFTSVMLWSQGNPATVAFKKASVAPVIDGTIDAVWADAAKINIELPFVPETPTVGSTGETYYQGLWDENGVYLLVTVKDNVWFPWYMASNGANTPYKCDKIEVYFDCNNSYPPTTLQDGKGAGAGSGHYQIAYSPIEANAADGISNTEADGTVWSYKVADPAYLVEEFIPWTILQDAEGNSVDKMTPLGFDITINDGDEADAAGDGIRNRMVWSNDGTNGFGGGTGESWNNMDGCGTLTFEGMAPDVLVTDINLTGGTTITTDNGTLQFTAEATPANATNKKVKWSVTSGTGNARIDQTGLLSAITNGTVTVTATSADAAGKQKSVEVTISGQTFTMDEFYNRLNVFQNWDFTNDVSVWINSIAADYGQLPYWENGYAVLSATVKDVSGGTNYQYQFNQQDLQAMPDVPYVFRFKAWADNDREIDFDFEDTPGNGWNRYGASDDAEAKGGRSEWRVAITTVPTFYEFHVTFDQIKSSTVQKLQFMLSADAGVVYIDSVLMVTADELVLKTPAAQQASIVKIYPNPVVNTLNIDLAKANSTVAIYNGIGQKLMEKTINGTRTQFDVSNLAKGMYFVKLKDGSCQKFVK